MCRPTYALFLSYKLSFSQITYFHYLFILTYFTIFYNFTDKSQTYKNKIIINSNLYVINFFINAYYILYYF